MLKASQRRLSEAETDRLADRLSRVPKHRQVKAERRMAGNKGYQWAPGKIAPHHQTTWEAESETPLIHHLIL